MGGIWRKSFDDLDVCPSCAMGNCPNCGGTNCKCGCLTSARWVHKYRENILPSRRSY